MQANYLLADADYGAAEAEDGWPPHLLAALDGAVSWLRPRLASSAWEALFHSLLDKALTRLEVRLHLALWALWLFACVCAWSTPPVSPIFFLLEWRRVDSIACVFPSNRQPQVLLSRKAFTQLGGLQLDRDVRVLVAATGEMTGRTVRDKFARLTQVRVAGWCSTLCLNVLFSKSSTTKLIFLAHTHVYPKQMATVLSCESVAEFLEYWRDGGGVTWRLTPAEVRAVLAQRADFSRDVVAALPL
jgi:hypothetical protein